MEQEYPDLRPFFSSQGVPPQGEDLQAYTIPTVKIDDEFTVDSKKIAHELEKRFPEPSLRLDSQELKDVEAALPLSFGSIYPAILPRIPRNILNPPSAEYFQRTRKEKYGMSLDEMEKTQGGDDAIEKAKHGLQVMAEIVKRNDGPFIMGQDGEW